MFARYALHLADTIQVGEDKSTILTEGVKSPKDTLFFLNGDSADEKPQKKDRKPPVQPRTNGTPAKVKTVGGKVLRNQTRRTQDEVHQTAAAKLAEHQRELHEKIHQEGLAKYSEEGGATSGKEGKGWKKFQSYKGEAALPAEVDKLRVRISVTICVRQGRRSRSNQIFVDRKAQTVILPIHGFAVPFHINAIKNASKNDEGEFTHLRINFQTPGQLAGKKEDTVLNLSLICITCSDGNTALRRP